jgi:hypothetical protein
MTQGLGRDPFDDLLAQREHAQPADSPSTFGPGRDRGPAAETARRTFELPVGLIEQVRDAAWALSGPPHQLTLNQLAADGLRREIRRLEREHNDGLPFPPRSGALRPGRRIEP